MNGVLEFANPRLARYAVRIERPVTDAFGAALAAVPR